MARFFGPFILCAVLAASAANLSCLLLDPFDVVWNREARELGGIAFDQYRFKKTEHLSADTSTFDTIVLGNSRSADLRTDALNRELGRHIYNFSVSADAPIGYSLKAHWLVQTQPKLKDVLLVLWWDQFQGAGTHWANHIAREHPAITGESWISYYWFFSNLPSATALKAMTFQFRAALGLSRDNRVIQNAGLNLATGDFDAWQYFAAWSAPPGGRTEFRKRLMNARNGELIFRNFAFSPDQVAALRNQLQHDPVREDQVQALRDTVILLRNSGIRPHCVIAPISAAITAMVPIQRYLEWMHWLVSTCQGIWDFSAVSPLTKDPWNYHDWSHFTTEIAHSMVRVALGDPTADIVMMPDIGQWVTEDNYVAHAEQWDRQMRAYLACDPPRVACPE